MEEKYTSVKEEGGLDQAMREGAERINAPSHWVTIRLARSRPTSGLPLQSCTVVPTPLLD